MSVREKELIIITPLRGAFFVRFYKIYVNIESSSVKTKQRFLWVHNFWSINYGIFFALVLVYFFTKKKTFIFVLFFSLSIFQLYFNTNKQTRKQIIESLFFWKIYFISLNKNFEIDSHNYDRKKKKIYCCLLIEILLL